MLKAEQSVQERLFWARNWKVLRVSPKLYETHSAAGYADIFQTALNIASLNFSTALQFSSHQGLLTVVLTAGTTVQDATVVNADLKQY
jgi:hypothetical protein